MIPARGALLVFVLVASIAAAWVAYTDHVWEDYYITFRASKHLATGNGLVYTPGERVHAFTSPLGVLLPALASAVTGNSSDAIALLLFRLVSIAALAGAAVLLWRIALRLCPTAAPAVLLVGLFATDNKIVDYSVNGMETGLLLFFLAWTLWALFTAPQRQAWHLGLAWAGLMWTRPDSCIYIAALTSASAVFPPADVGRGVLLRRFLGAGAVAAIIYLPWLAWSWWYYGSAIPHTISAKGLFHGNSLVALANALLEFPGKIWKDQSSLAATFVPAYGLETGWPAVVRRLSLALSLLMMFLWLAPRVRPEVRVTSLGFLAGHLYVTGVVLYPFPWYIPTITTLGLVSLGLVIGQIVASTERSAGPLRTVGRVLQVAVGVLVLASISLAVLAAHNFRTQQRIVENGNRRVLGEWLRAESRSPHDTVFLEPLGYIGYFSGLKMLDFPGLSSPEVVAARKRAPLHDAPQCWPEIIRDLRPDWLVLRPFEVRVITERDPDLLAHEYHRVRSFDVRDAIAAVQFLPGRGYLEFDAVFEVYRRADLRR